MSVLQFVDPRAREGAQRQLARGIHAETRETLRRSIGTGHDDRRAIAEQRQRLLNRKQRAAHIQIEGRIEVLLRNLTQWQCLALAGTREQDVDLPLLALDRIEQAVQIVQISCVTLDAGYIPANRLHGLIELLLPSTRDENVSAFFNEQLGTRQRHAARTTCNDCNFSFKLSHDFSFDRSVRFNALSFGGSPRFQTAEKPPSTAKSIPFT